MNNTILSASEDEPHGRSVTIAARSLPRWVVPFVVLCLVAALLVVFSS